MADLYLFNDLIYGERPKVYTKPEFIKALNNYNIQAYLHPEHFPEAFQILPTPTDYLGSYSNLENAIGAYKDYLEGFYETKEELAKAIKLINQEKQKGYGYIPLNQISQLI